MDKEVILKILAILLPIVSIGIMIGVYFNTENYNLVDAFIRLIVASLLILVNYFVFKQLDDF